MNNADLSFETKTKSMAHVRLNDRYNENECRASCLKGQATQSIQIFSIREEKS